jgi:hypothetical protein
MWWSLRLEKGRLGAHIPGMGKKAKFFWFAIGFWAALTLPLAAISFWILGYDRTIGLLLFAVAGLLVGLAIFWWLSRGKNLETPTRQL